MSLNNRLLTEAFVKAISSREKEALKKSLGVTAIHWNFAPKKENTLNPMISSIEAEIMENQFLVFPNKIGSSFDDW